MNASFTPTVTKASIGLGSVDNTSDANKPVSTAQQTALDLKADKDGNYVLNGLAAYSAQRDENDEAIIGTYARRNRSGAMVITLDQDNTASSDTTLSNIDMGDSANHPEGLSVLGFTLAANERASFSAILFEAETSSSDNIKIGATCPAGATGVIAILGRGQASVNMVAYQFDESSMASGVSFVSAGLPAATKHVMTLDGVIVNGATPGNFVLQFSQGSSTAETTRIKLGSTLTKNITWVP